ncbi:MAG: ABC transporter ATP-binding protein [Chitinophagaceae bacterium]|nr:ABC transporter ATP-binding protein [Chitinophagaceae bacterium]
MNTIIRVKNLSKRFGDLQAVDQLSFSVSAGEVYGFLGQNGAGKSTTIRMLLTLIDPDEGEIEIFGMNLRQHRKEILKRTGAVIERPDLYKYLSALDNLRIFARLSGMKASRKQLMDQLEMVGLAERANSRVKTYSQGMKQRLGLACALVHDPGLIILDEPTNGLDPQGIAEMREMIIRLSQDGGKTLLVSSHLLSEMEMMASSLLIIDKGRKVAEGKLDELLNPKTALVELAVTDKAAARQLLGQTDWIHGIQKQANNCSGLKWKNPGCRN